MERPIDLMLDLSPGERRFRASVTVQDPSMATALGYLTSGSLPQASAILDRAQDMLYEKLSNPYAAAAGGYLMLEEDHPSRGDSWKGWIGNLGEWFPWLPDGAVLDGWVQLMQGKPDQAAERFRSAFERGVPLYSGGVKRLVDGLNLLASEDDSFLELEKKVRRIAWRTNMDQCFTILRLGSS